MSNPLMVLVLTTDILYKLRKQFGGLELRIDFFNQTFQENFFVIFEHFQAPERIESMLKQKDIHGVNILQYLAKLNMYKFLQINMVTRIVSGMWESKTDIGGSMFDLATSYDLTFTNKLNDQEDNELLKRFYMKRDYKEKPEPHQFSFIVWKKSISLRYILETILFFILMIIFQSQVSGFNKNLHGSIDEVRNFQTLGNEIISRGGTLYSGLEGDRMLKETNSPLKSKKIEEKLRKNSGGRGLYEIDYSKLNLKEMQETRETLHDELYNKMLDARDDLSLILYISAITFLIPVGIFCKLIFAKLTKRKFYLSMTDYFDLTIFVLVLFLWGMIDQYETNELTVQIFSPK